MFTEFDVLVSVVVLGCIISSMLRGAVKDVLTIFAYAMAATITLFLQPTIAAFTEEVFRLAWLVNIGAVIVIFILTLALISLFNAMILDNLREMRNGTLDRSLGMVFGFLKGFIYVSILHFSITQLAKDEPGWLKAGETYRLTHIGAGMVGDVVGDYFSEEKESMDDKDPLIEPDDFEDSPAEVIFDRSE